VERYHPFPDRVDISGQFTFKGKFSGHLVSREIKVKDYPQIAAIAKAAGRTRKGSMFSRRSLVTKPSNEALL
jgi:hypothetical protein